MGRSEKSGEGKSFPIELSIYRENEIVLFALRKE